jgi:hypothetical protein
MPHSLIDHAPQPSPRARWLALIALVAAAGLLWNGPVPQWESYHHFADARSWLGMPNAANVLSNLPFAAIGAWGLWRLWRLREFASDRPGWRAWLAFSIAVACTAAGSALYHWAPSNGTLVFDRLPIAWACATLLCGFLAERVHPRWASATSLLAAVVLSSLSVVYWWLSEQWGQGDLRPYLFVQFLPMALVPAALLMQLAPRQQSGVPGRAWWTVLALYAAAKLMEIADDAVLDALVVTSGHTLKHLLAAAAAACVLRAAGATVPKG